MYYCVSASWKVKFELVRCKVLCNTIEEASRRQAKESERLKLRQSLTFRTERSELVPVFHVV